MIHRSNHRRSDLDFCGDLENPLASELGLSLREVDSATPSDDGYGNHAFHCNDLMSMKNCPYI